MELAEEVSIAHQLTPFDCATIADYPTSTHKQNKMVQVLPQFLYISHVCTPITPYCEILFTIALNKNKWISTGENLSSRLAKSSCSSWHTQATETS